MPKSKTRKGHKKRLAKRKRETELRNHQLKKMFTKQFESQMTEIEDRKSKERELVKAAAAENTSTDILTSMNDPLALPKDFTSEKINDAFTKGLSTEL